MPIHKGVVTDPQLESLQFYLQSLKQKGQPSETRPFSTGAAAGNHRGNGFKQDPQVAPQGARPGVVQIEGDLP